MAETDFALLPYQARLLSDRSPVVVVEKSRRIGITWALALLAVITAASQTEAGGQNVYYMVYAENDARLFIEDCAFWADALEGVAARISVELLEDRAHPDRSIQVRTIRFASGYRITILSSNPRTLRGKEGLLIIDEAAFLDDLAEVRKAANAFLMWRQGRIFIVSTHNGEENPFNLLCEQVRSGEKKYSLHRIDLDDALGDGFYKRVCAKARARGVDVRWSERGQKQYRDDLLSEEGSEEELLCKPVGGGGVYIARKLIKQAQLPAWPRGPAVVRITFPGDFLSDSMSDADRDRWVRHRMRDHVDPVLRRIQRDRPVVFGVDVARHQDLTAIWLLVLNVNGSRTTPIVIELARAPHNEQWQILRHVVETVKAAAGRVDRTGVGSWLGEQAERFFGPSWLGVQITEQWHDEAWPPLKKAFETGMVSIPSDQLIETDLLKLKRKDGKPRLSKAREKNKAAAGFRHGDTAIALALANESADTINLEGVVFHEVVMGAGLGRGAPGL